MSSNLNGILSGCTGSLLYKVTGSGEIGREDKLKEEAIKVKVNCKVNAGFCNNGNATFKLGRIYWNV